MPPLAGETTTTFDRSGALGIDVNGGVLAIDDNDALIRQNVDGVILEVVCAHCMTPADVEDMQNVMVTDEYLRNGGVLRIAWEEVDDA